MADDGLRHLAEAVAEGRARRSPTRSAGRLLRRNLGVYGLGGLVAPFIGIKLIDLLISTPPGLR